MRHNGECGICGSEVRPDAGECRACDAVWYQTQSTGLKLLAFAIGIPSVLVAAAGLGMFGLELMGQARQSQLLLYLAWIAAGVIGWMVMRTIPLTHGTWIASNELTDDI